MPEASAADRMPEPIEAEPAPAPAAQPAPMSPEQQAARDAFVQGAEAADQGRWADAVRLFELSLESAPRPNTLYNLGMALRAMGRHRDARDTFSRLIDQYPTSRSAAEALPLRQEESERVAVLSLVGLDAEAEYAVRLDGLGVEGSGPTRTLETDPGRHAVEIDRDGYHSFAWEGQLADGARETVTVEMEELPSQSIFKKPGFWIITAVVLAGAGVGTYFILDNQAQLDPQSNNVVVLD